MVNNILYVLVICVLFNCSCQNNNGASYGGSIPLPVQAEILYVDSTMRNAGTRLVKQGESLYGRVEISGYFININHYEENDEYLKRFEFVVMEAPGVFVEHYSDLVNIGNTINYLNDSGQLVVSVLFDQGFVDVSLFRKTSPKSQISLLLDIPQPLGRDAESFFEKNPKVINDETSEGQAPN